MKHYKSEIKDNAKHQTKNPKDGTKSSQCISNDTKCPIHPNTSHILGKCYANAGNKKAHKTDSDKDKKCPGQLKKMRSTAMPSISAMMMCL
jgi:hypothetical protein